VPGRTGEGSYIIHPEDGPVKVVLPGQREDAIARFSNGVGLISLGFVNARTYVGFSVPNSPDRTFYGGLDYDYQVFFHALDASGNRIAQRDATFYPGRDWCAGDTISVDVDLDLTDAVTLRVGFYRILDAETSAIEPVDVLDVAGNPAGNWVDIPLTEN
jgi:hypothetical protein